MFKLKSWEDCVLPARYDFNGVEEIARKVADDYVETALLRVHYTERRSAVRHLIRDAFLRGFEVGHEQASLKPIDRKVEEDGR